MKKQEKDRWMEKGASRPTGPWSWKYPQITQITQITHGLGYSGEINGSFLALAFVLPPSIIPTSNRNLRNLCNLRIIHLPSSAV
jgi:hypothetical protein